MSRGQRSTTPFSPVLVLDWRPRDFATLRSMSRDKQILAREAALDRERSAFFADREAERKALAAAEAAFDQRAARFELRLTSLLSRIAAFALSAGAGGGVCRVACGGRDTAQSDCVAALFSG